MNAILYQDEHVIIIKDKKNNAEAHYQCISKRHIKNYKWLKLDKKLDLDLLNHMDSTGNEFLKKNHADKVETGQFRVGFHKPMYVTQFHLHLHLIILPLKHPDRHAITYGVG